MNETRDIDGFTEFLVDARRRAWLRTSISGDLNYSISDFFGFNGVIVR